jgi:hypothetical protein
LKLLQHVELKSKQILVISPRIEDWFLKRTKKNNIDLSDFGLKPTFDYLHGININKNKGYRDFIDHLTSNDAEVKIILTWIETFCNKSF